MFSQTAFATKDPAIGLAVGVAMRGQGSSEARVHKKRKNGIHGGMVEVEGG